MLKNYFLLLFVLLLCGGLKAQNPCIDTLYRATNQYGDHRDIAPIDWNGDGAMDYVFINSDSDKVYVQYRNAGNRLFASGIPQAIAPILNPAKIQIADINNDFNNDIVILHHGAGGDSIKIFLSNGAGGVMNMIGFGITWAGHMIVDDMNLDGFQDIITAEDMLGAPGNNVYTYIGDGSGAFPLVNTRFVANSDIVDLAIADFDNDGDNDLFIGSNDYGTPDSSKVFILPNITPVGNPALEFGAPVFTHIFAVDVEKRLCNITAADYNNDGFADCAVSLDLSGMVAVFINNTVGSMNTPAFFSVGTFPKAIASGDIDGDGDMDIVTSLYYGSADYILYSDGAGAFPTNDVISTLAYYTRIHVVDMDGDGANDLLKSSLVNQPAFDARAGVIYNNTGASIILTPSGSGTYCPGTTALVAATSNNSSFQSGATYNWNSGLSSNDTLSVVMNSNQTFSISMTNTNGCVINSFINLFVHSLPDVELGTDINTCNSSPVSLSPASGGPNFYNWSSNPPGFGAGTYSVSVSPAFPTTYYIAATSSVTGCFAMDSIRVSINNPSPSLTLVGPFANHVCLGDSLHLGTILTAGNGTPPYNFNWSYGFGTLPNVPNPVYTPTTTATFSVGISDAYGCTQGFTTSFSVILDGANTDLRGHVTTPSPVTDVDNGLVYAFLYQPGAAGYDTVGTAPLDANGEYTFVSMDNGSYLIKAIADEIAFPMLVPTYFGDAFQWDSSVVVTHGCTQIDTADIEMIQLPVSTGPGIVSGYVFEGDSFGVGARYGGNQGPLYPCVPGGPLKGIDVKLGKNPGGGIQARVMTDSTGKYEFTNLPLLGYRIYVDIPNLPMDSTREIVLDATNNVSTQNNYFADSASIYINPDTVIPVGIYASGKIYDNHFTVFPNPAKDQISLRLDIDNGNDIEIEITDAVGHTVRREYVKGTVTGSTTYTINLSYLHIRAGVYFISVQNENRKYTQRLVVIE